MDNSIASLASNLQGAVSDVQARLQTTHTQIADGKRPLSTQESSVVARLSAQATSQSAVQASITNANNIIDVTQTGLNSAASILTQMKDIATQVANSLYNSTDKTNLTNTFTKLNTALTSIAASTGINGNFLLSSDDTLSILSGSDGVNNQTISVKGFDLAALQETLNLNTVSFADSTVDTTSTSTVAGTDTVYAQQTISLNAMSPGDSYQIGDLKFTAAASLTGTEVAAIFASKMTSNTNPSSSLGSFGGDVFSGDYTGASSGNVLTLTGTSYGEMTLASVTQTITGGTAASTVIVSIDSLMAKISATQASMTAATTNLNTAQDDSTAIAASSQKLVDGIQNIDLTALQADLQKLSVQQSLDFQVVAQLNSAASSLLSIFR
jgi:flagellin-like hook-associated protein FlgL